MLKTTRHIEYWDPAAGDAGEIITIAAGEEIEIDDVPADRLEPYLAAGVLVDPDAQAEDEPQEPAQAATPADPPESDAAADGSADDVAAGDGSSKAAKKTTKKKATKKKATKKRTRK